LIDLNPWFADTFALDLPDDEMPMAVTDLPISDGKIILNENHRITITLIHALSTNIIIKNSFDTIFRCMGGDEGDDADEDDDDQDEDDEVIFVEEGLQVLYDPNEWKLSKQF
jgi:hypothetical protein